MRLKKLILHGFKSFADRTEFVFDAPITGIVGPNGCGKSNVVDGFKWVLGEQSAKSLRGEAMLDVIFNGSGGRKPAGMSEVVLVFENPTRADGTRLLNLDTDEVSVGRRLFRDGTSEYQLNNQSSRLKDIRELFFDTGVGVDAYSVIEQGRVAAMLEANPDERRLIFEEAAGISKFKAKKKESQRKLERVDQNLIRLHDIVEEVEKRLRSVKIQAGRARTYQEYSVRLNELRLTYALQEYHVHFQQLEELEKNQADAQFRLDDIAGDLASKQNALAQQREQFDQLSQHKQKVEYELVQARAAMQSAQQREQYARQQLAQIAEQIAAFEHDRAALEAKLAEVTESLNVETETLQRLTDELAGHRRLIDERQEAFRDGQLRLNEFAQNLEKEKSAVLELMRRLASVNSRLGAIEIERKNITSQQVRLAERRRVVIEELEALETQRAGQQQKLDEVLAMIARQQNELEQKRATAADLGKQIAEISDQLGSAKEHRSGLMSREKLLKDLEARREGMSEGVKSVLRQRDQKFNFVRGLVADILRVDVEHAHAVEAALDGRDQWLVAPDGQNALAAREAFEELEGRVNVICADELTRDTGFQPVPAIQTFIENGSLQTQDTTHGLEARVTSSETYDWNQHPQNIRLAIDLVRFEPRDAAIAQHLLGHSVIVDDLASAQALHQSGPRGWRYITLAGEVIESDGTFRAGPLTAAMGLLSRRSELEALAQQIADVDRRIESLTQGLTAGNAQAKSLEEDQNAARNAVYQSNTSKVELTSAIAQNADKQNALRREQPILDRELQMLLDQVGRLKSEEITLTEQRQALETDQAARHERIEQMTADQQKLSGDLKHWGEQLTASRVQLGQIQEKQLASEQHVQRQTAAQAELGQQIERIVRSAESVASRQYGVENELQAAQHAQQQLIQSQEELAEQVETVVNQQADAQQAVQALTGQVESARGEHAEIEQELHQVQMKLSELKVRQETLVSRTLEELQLDLPAKYAEGYEPADMDWDAVAAEIKELRDKIHRLGNVNLDSLGELDELEKRQQFLAIQFNDLTESKKQLEELISQINTESGLRFEQTFNTVREHFQGMFRKLFGGGKADIYLETELEEKGTEVRGQGSENASGDSSLTPDPSPLAPKKIDILDAGIEIIARPPGKQPVSISQLSGGEKTMTCVALLMSIFKSKPSPFCILDEVDAALDEANNQRFNLIVQEFLDMSQFIIITHSKRTMQIADVLYGVTMQEQGVSKRVAVKFDQVDSQGRISEQAAA
jgi:chromosome segregation protein